MSIIKKAVGGVKKMVANRIQAQKNFKARSSNKNYYGSAKKWK